MDGLRGLLRSGRPTRVRREAIDRIIDRACQGKCAPKKPRELVRAEAGMVYGAIAKDGRQFFRTCEWFDATSFVAYLREVQRYFGKVAW